MKARAGSGAVEFAFDGAMTLEPLPSVLSVEEPARISTGVNSQQTYQHPRSYGVNQHLHPYNFENRVVKLAGVDKPAETVSLFDSCTGHPAANIGNCWHPDYWPNGECHQTHNRVPPRHNGMANFAFADGHAKSMGAPETTSPTNMWELN